jgi:hypothetical protein
MWRYQPILLFVLMAGCADANPAEVKSDASEFAVRASWNANVSPVGSAAVRGAVEITEYLGFRMDAVATLNAASPNATYQWRIFRGDCATTAVAPNATTLTGLRLFATVESYPDITANAAGAATLARTIAGTLDSLTAYSVRIRPSQPSTNWNGTNPIACGNIQRTGGA